MKRRLMILTEIISPYRIPLFNAMARREGIDLHVIFLSETDSSLRQWHVYKQDIHFSFQVLPSWRKRIGKYNLLLNRGLARALHSASPDAIVCGGYNYWASWQALRWARSHRVPFLLWSESNLQDLRNERVFVEFLKRQFLKRCSGFVVPGKSAGEYMKAHGANERSIFTAPNAVDNDLFASASSAARQSAAKCRAELDVPARYFLYAGRLVREKGVLDLLAAYAKLDAALREKVGLVFVGDGPLREQLERQAASISPGTIKLAGFAHREQLAAHYAFADGLILPTHSDPWGLVVNEAMASGLPVIVSQVAGCAADLVRENWNGFLVPPGDIESLAAAMQKLACGNTLRATMAANSVQLIAQYSPQVWAEGLERAVETFASAHG
jgi:1,2-diacylglycerol 3-alpha-glucosyltransferase